MSKEFAKPRGVCLYTENEVGAKDFARVLARVASALQAKDPYVRLHRYDDWWEHDGLHFHRGIIDFHAFFELVHSPKELLESTPADDYVFVGITSDDNEWYVRYRVEWDDEETELIGHCAVIVDPSRTDVLKEFDKVSWVKRTDADTYYRETIL